MTTSKNLCILASLILGILLMASVASAADQKADDRYVMKTSKEVVAIEGEFLDNPDLTQEVKQGLVKALETKGFKENEWIAPASNTFVLFAGRYEDGVVNAVNVYCRSRQIGATFYYEKNPDKLVAQIANFLDQVINHGVTDPNVAFQKAIEN